MPICLICQKNFEMITESHMQKEHGISCKDYAQKFNLEKGKLNPHHSNNMSGQGNPRYGAIISQNTREKIRDIHKQSKRFAGDGNPMFGKTHTIEVRKILSAFHKGKMVGNKNPFFGKKHSEATKQKISSIRIEKGLAKGKNNPLFGKGHTEKTKNKISLLKKNFFREYPEKHINSIIASNYKNQKNKKGGYISKKQVDIYELLQKKFPDARLNYPIKTEGGLYFADVGIPSLKIDVEYDSSYWHKDTAKDTKRDQNIKMEGWNIIRIKDKQTIEITDKKLGEYLLVVLNEK